MPITLTPGTNTFGTLDESTAYFSEVIIGKLWNTISDVEDKKRYLVSAYKALNGFRFVDEITDDEGHYLSWIKEAQYLEAYSLFTINSDVNSTIRESLQKQGIKEFNLDNKNRETYGKRTKIHTLTSQEAFRLISTHILRYPTQVIAGM